MNRQPSLTVSCLQMLPPSRRHAPTCVRLLIALGASVCVLSCSQATRPGRTVSLDVDTVLGEVGSNPGQFVYPRAMDAGNGWLWVIDKTARVQRIDPRTGDCRGGWRMPEMELGKPTGVTVFAPDNGTELVIVPDTHYHRVMVYRPNPAGQDGAELVLSFGSYGEGDGQLIYPTDVVVIPTADGATVDRYYVAEYGGHDRVSIFDAQGAFIRSFGVFGVAEHPEQAEFNRPQSMVLDSGRNELLITDSANHRVGRFTLEGEVIEWHGSPALAGTGPGQLRYPYGITLLPDGTALVSEFGNNRLQRLDPQTGRWLEVFVAPDSLREPLRTPWTTCVMDGSVFVLDSGNNRVLRVRGSTFRAGRSG